MPGMSSTVSPNATFNQADADFATGMAAHHEQAIKMSDVLLAKTAIDPRVTALATEVKAAQGPEIIRMKAWLTEWKSQDSSLRGMDNGAMVMSKAATGALANSSGAKAAKLFLLQMTTHHEAALAMARVEIADGKNAEARALAKSIDASQSLQLTSMAQILATL